MNDINSTYFIVICGKHLTRVYFSGFFSVLLVEQNWNHGNVFCNSEFKDSFNQIKKIVNCNITSPEYWRQRLEFTATTYFVDFLMKVRVSSVLLLMTHSKIFMNL